MIYSFVVFSFTDLVYISLVGFVLIVLAIKESINVNKKCRELDAYFQKEQKDKARNFWRQILFSIDMLMFNQQEESKKQELISLLHKLQEEFFINVGLFPSLIRDDYLNVNDILNIENWRMTNNRSGV